jgi:phosphoribosylanthranilate isomerase
MVKVKICGVTTEEDAEVVEKAGADFVGVIIDVPVETPRKISLEQAKKISEQVSTPLIAVLIPQSFHDVERCVKKLEPWGIQLHGYEPIDFLKKCRDLPAKIIKTLHIDPSGNIRYPERRENYLEELSRNVDFLLADTATTKRMVGIKKVGKGVPHNWDVTRKIGKEARIPLFLAGGLTPSNVKEAIEKVGPWGVDTASGVESVPGRKDPSKVRDFVRRAGEAR